MFPQVVATQTFLEFSPRSLGFHDPIWRLRIFFRLGWLKPPTSHSLFGPVGLFVKDKPLVIPEINGDGLVSEPLIANPNCTTAVGAMALWPIHQKYKLKKVPDLQFLDSGNGKSPSWKFNLVELKFFWGF